MRGFTLVELLVVVLIIGLGISIIGVNVGNNNSFQMQTEAKQFANNTALMAQEAVLSNRQWGVDIYREAEGSEERFGYRWLVLDDYGHWQQPVTEEFAREYLFSEDVGLRLQLDGLDIEQDIEFKQEVKAAGNMDERETENKNLHQLKIIGEDNSITDREKVQPEIWLQSSGEMNAFVLAVYNRDNPDAAIKVTGDELGRVKLDMGDEEDGYETY